MPLPPVLLFANISMFTVVLSKQEPAIPKAKIEQLNTVFEAMNWPKLELLKLHASMYMVFRFTQICISFVGP